MVLLIDSQDTKNALRGLLTEVSGAGASIGIEDLSRSIDGGELSLEQCSDLTRAVNVLSGYSRFTRLRELATYGALVHRKEDALVSLDYMPLEENWESIWIKFASTSLPMDVLHELAERGRISDPNAVKVIDSALRHMSRLSLSKAMHSAGGLLLRFFADDGHHGMFEITMDDPLDAHPESVVRRLSERGIRESVYLLYKVIGEDGVDEILRSYAVQLAFFIAKHRADALAGDKRDFFIDKVVRPVLLDSQMFHVYTAYLTLRLMDPEAASRLEYGDVGHYPSLGGEGSKIEQYFEVTASSLREGIFETVLEGLSDVEESYLNVVPFDMTRPRHVLSEYRPDKPVGITDDKYELLKKLASQPGFTQTAMWSEFFSLSQNGMSPPQRDIVMLEFGGSSFYVLDGHHRIAAAILGAANGIIPPEWITGIPAIVWTTRELPVPLMQDILTLGVELTWPDLFPDDEKVQRFFAKKGGGAFGGNSNGSLGSGGGSVDPIASGGISRATQPAASNRMPDGDRIAQALRIVYPYAMHAMGLRAFITPTLRTPLV